MEVLISLLSTIAIIKNDEGFRTFLEFVEVLDRVSPRKQKHVTY